MNLLTLRRGLRFAGAEERTQAFALYVPCAVVAQFHIHATSEDGEAKFWLEPIVSLAVYHGLSRRRLNDIEKIVEEHKDEITEAWQRHFGKR